MTAKIIPLLTLLTLLSGLSIAASAEVLALEDVIASPHRAASATRDKYRHPQETLRFFEVNANMSVVEIWPGGSGWYTEILGPFLRDHGKFYAAHFNADSSAAYYRTGIR